MVCVQIVPETHDVCSFYFRAKEPLLFNYKPGQFATLELKIDGASVKRSYTISSSPSRPHLISVTIKRVPGGRVSNWMHEHMSVWQEISIHGPNGEFNCFDYPSKKMLLISGGSGITPCMSMLRYVCDTASPVDVVFVHSARTPIDIPFASELESLGVRNNVKTVVNVSKVPAGMTWNGYRGRISEEMIKMMVPDLKDRTVYICGPDPYMKAVKGLFENMGFDMKRYHQESFGGEQEDVSQKEPKDIQPEP